MIGDVLVMDAAVLMGIGALGGVGLASMAFYSKLLDARERIEWLEDSLRRALIGRDDATTR